MENFECYTSAKVMTNYFEEKIKLGKIYSCSHGEDSAEKLTRIRIFGLYGVQYKSGDSRTDPEMIKVIGKVIKVYQYLDKVHDPINQQLRDYLFKLSGALREAYGKLSEEYLSAPTEAYKLIKDEAKTLCELCVMVKSKNQCE